MISRFTESGNLNLVQTGFLPFGEFPEQSSSWREQALLALGLDPALKTVLYTPSRREQGSWEYAAMDILRTVPAHFNLVLRPHPSQSLTPRAKDRASFKAVAAAALKRPNVLLDLTSKPLPVLQSVTDLVVSDANSPAEESLFYDVPQLFIETARFSQAVMRSVVEREGMHPHDVEQLMTLYDCGERVWLNDGIDFSTRLDSCIENSESFAAQRARYFAWVFGHRDRLAGKRVASAIRSRFLQ
jgi:hypothetical protein